jgi:outer membrane protein OmpA-like peptidoglycan-associated protein/tetratricopeptide (TPR) repeat protein
MKKVTLLFLLVFLVGSTSFAQKSKLQRANAAFEDYNYQTAIELYLEILDKTDVSEAKIKLAESYRKVNNMAEAEFWYGQVVHLPEAKPIYYLYYGKSLQANGKCDLAKPWFEKYSIEEPDDLRGQLLANTCDREELEKMIASRKDFYEIKKLPFNTAFDDFGPAFFKGGIVFASERDNTGPTARIHEWTGYPFLDLYYTKVDTVDAEALEFKYEGKPKKYEKKLNTKYHDGPICFSRDGKEIFFTRNNLDERNRVGKDDEGTIRLKVFRADLNGDKWENLEGLPFNSDEYSVAHPTLDPDGKTLYFASDMPGGFGGMDLYYTVKEDGSWSPPRNLGPRINTEGHEVFPYVHSSGRLYFSSDGHVGLGMLDIYYIDNQNGVWGPPMNIGFPINTSSDDFGLILNEEETFGYFSSNREGGVGRDDIYSFKYSVVKVEVLVYDENTNDPIENASVLDDCSGLELFTGSNGRVTIELPLNKCCTFTASKDAYIDNALESCTQDYKASTKVFVKIPLSQPMDFAIEGIVYDEETKEPLANSTVTLMPDCGGESMEFETDATGRYRFVLDKECCYSLKAENEGYFAVSTDKPYCTKGLKKSQNFVHDFPLQRFVDLPPGGPGITGTGGPGEGGTPGTPDDDGGVGSGVFPCDGIARTFVIEHIYYDFDKAYIRSDAEEPLSQLIKILNDNPDLIVEIGSHTDARGSNRYNIRLSARRAESVVKYLIRQDIGSERLQAKGYGETQPTNDCVDEIPCSEEQHQRNRRTEFRVVGKVDGTRYDCDVTTMDINQISVEPILLKKIDKCENCPF